MRQKTDKAAANLFNTTASLVYTQKIPAQTIKTEVPWYAQREHGAAYERTYIHEVSSWWMK